MATKDINKLRATQKRYRDKNREKRNQANREWYSRNSEKMRKAMSEYRKNHKDKVNFYNSAWTRNETKIRTHLVQQGYGGKCICCGETEELFLQIHHSNGGGRADIKEKGGSQFQFYKWLIDNKFPEGYWLLCANCHVGIHRSKEGICPHRLKRDRF
jgi:hypothetical protein